MARTQAEREGVAWEWLARIERLSWQTTGRRRMDTQVTVEMSPHGNLRRDDGSRVSPYVVVRVRHPKPPKPIRGSGNSLMIAVKDVWAEMHRAGVSLPPPDLPDVTQEEWDKIRTPPTEGKE